MPDYSTLINVFFNQEPKMTMTADIPTSQHVDTDGTPIILFTPYTRQERWLSREILVPIQYLSDGALRVISLGEPDNVLATGYRLGGTWLRPADPFTVAQLQELIKALGRATNHHAASVESMTGLAAAAEKRHQDDIAIIGAKLIEEAESRRWCSDYDDIVSTINEELTMPLPLRTRTYDVEVELTYRVTVQVEATSGDHATLQVEDDWELAYSEVSTSDVHTLNVREAEES